MTNGEVRWVVRPAIDTDLDFLLNLGQRLTIGTAAWLDGAAMLKTMQGYLRTDLAKMGPDQTVFIAQTRDGQPVGAITVARSQNFTGEAQAYIGELAVIAEVEGQGVGSVLLEAAEVWAREHRLAILVLDTGAANHHARAFYERRGYAEESVRLVKVLQPLTDQSGDVAG